MCNSLGPIPQSNSKRLFGLSVVNQGCSADTYPSIPRHRNDSEERDIDRLEQAFLISEAARFNLTEQEAVRQQGSEAENVSRALHIRACLLLNARPSMLPLSVASPFKEEKTHAMPQQKVQELMRMLVGTLTMKNAVGPAQSANWAQKPDEETREY